MTKPRGVGFEKMEQAIVDTAGILFERKGFNQTSLQDIAKEVGMARPSLYHYFENREQILAAGIEVLIEQRDATTQKLRGVDGNPVERLTALMHGLGTLVTEHPVWVRIALREEAALPEDTRVRDRTSRLEFFDLVVRALREGDELGYLRVHDERATAMTIIAALTSLQGQYTATANTTPEETTRLAVDVLLNGVLNPERHPGTPLQRGLALIREGIELIERAQSSS